MRVLRWGRSAYETDADLDRERVLAEELGYAWALHPDPRAVPHGARGVDVLVITSKARVTASVLDALVPRVVLTTTSGVDHVDVDAARARGVVVGRCPLARRDAVVDHAVVALGALLRRIPEQVAAARAGAWARAQLPHLAPRGLHGAVVVVVGVGVIGRRTAEVLGALGAVVRPVDPVVPDAWRLDDALDGADAVTLHCSLTPSSVGLLDGARLARLPPHGVVVNTARGEVLDLDAAVAAVRAGRLRGVAADVFAVEPHPRMAEAGHPGIWFTPHAAGFTHDLGARVAAEVGRALAAVAANAPLPHPVD